jgi:serine/threonine protein kinase
MAEVFAGHVMGDHGFQKPVAIKRLLPELANDKVFVERLIGEAKLLVGLQHGNIVSVLDLARDGEDVFLVMDFVDGPSLRQLLKARGTRGLPLGVASYIVQSAAAGLEFAHGRAGGAIIHADISPSNLLLTTSGEVRVADFGIARREGGAFGIVEGKWAYMAPEQARGEPLTPRSDVFALGVVLYELITGAHPFGRQVTADERESEQMRVIPPRVVRPSVPHGLDQICMRALSHDPRERYARMQQMIDAIVEERFTNQWRDGASDLAHAIREVVPAVAVNGGVGPRTMVTDRPVTIVTRSLIEVTPHRRSAPRLVERTPAPIAMDPASAYSTSASTSASASASEVESELDAAATPPMFEIPAALRLDGPPMPAFRLPDARMPAADLASVHGGTAHSVHVAASPVGEARSNKWPIIVMSAAAILGIIAAVVLQLRPTSVDAKPAPTATVAKVATPPSPVIVEPPAPPPVATVAPAPAPTIPEVAPTPETTAPATQDTATQDTATQDAAPVAEETVAKPKTQARAKVVATAKKRDPGFLRVNAYGWAYVKIDGGNRTYANMKFTLAPGRHVVKMWNDSGAQQTKVVTIVSNKVKTINVNLSEDLVEEQD